MGIESGEITPSQPRGIICVHAVQLFRAAHYSHGISMPNKFERRTWLLFGKIPLFSSEKVLESTLFINGHRYEFQ